MTARVVVPADSLGDPVRLLANPVNRMILAILGAGPSHPREIARLVGITEGDAQRKLGRLARAGFLEGAWRHDGRTVKEYRLVVSTIEVGISPAGLTVSRRPVDADPGPA